MPGRRCRGLPLSCGSLLSFYLLPMLTFPYGSRPSPFPLYAHSITSHPIPRDHQRMVWSAENEEIQRVGYMLRRFGPSYSRMYISRLSPLSSYSPSCHDHAPSAGMLRPQGHRSDVVMVGSRFSAMGDGQTPASGWRGGRGDTIPPYGPVRTGKGRAGLLPAPTFPFRPRSTWNKGLTKCRTGCMTATGASGDDL